MAQITINSSMSINDVWTTVVSQFYVI